MQLEIELMQGGLHVDERGVVRFVNEFDVKGADRFYTIRAHQPGRPRGWVGHRIEHKWFTALAGAVLIAVVQPDNWQSPSGSLEVHRFVLSDAKPAVLHIPPGHACAMTLLTDDALLGVFSSGKHADAAQDDWRFAADMWKAGN